MSSKASTSPNSTFPQQYRCTHPGCTRSFKRKEHLNRHAKSHDGNLKHRCDICGSTFARSDVLRRHVQHHPQSGRVGRIHTACTPCHERKIKCDNDTPCSSCVRSSITCYRKEHSDSITQAAGPLARLELSNDGSITQRNVSESFSTVHDDLSIADAIETDTEAEDLRAQTEDEVRQLTSLGDISPQMTHLVAVYFTDVHAVWPVLHQSTFEQSRCTRTLLMAVGTMGSYFDGSEHHTKLAPVLYPAILSALVEVEIYFQDLQAGFLTLVYYLHFATSKRMLEKATHLNAVLIAIYRSRGVFIGQCEGQHDESDPFRDWVHQEEVKRLAFFTMRIDTYLSLISDRPPTVRYAELEHSLPKSESLWSASSYGEQQRLEWNEPAAREKMLFANLVYDAANTQGNLGQLYRLTENDHHMLLCSLQNEAWNVSHQPSLSRCPKMAAEPGWTPQVAVFSSQLELWAQAAEEYSRLSQRYFAGTSEEDTSMITSVSLCVWHLMAIRLHYPINDPPSANMDSSTGGGGGGDGYNIRPRGANDIRQRLESVNSRTALWHAAQITRVYVHEVALIPSSVLNRRSRLNHFHPSGVSRAAVLICKYARYVQSCPACTGEPLDSVDLIAADQDDEVLQRWTQQGNICAFMRLGSAEFSLCSCNFKALASWYQKLLEGHDYFRDACAAFLQVIQRP